jgi:hypothetical protein
MSTPFLKIFEVADKGVLARAEKLRMLPSGEEGASL